jgi:AcrR family transcriptional regulator
VQEVALDLFEARGYDAVSIDEIARAAEVGPATIYRNFGTKERIVMWDDYDPMLLEALARELTSPGDVLDAVYRGLSAALAQHYRQDHARILRRTRLILTAPALVQASADDVRVMRERLTELFLTSKRARDRLEARVFAGAITAALESAMEHWLAAGGQDSLAKDIAMAFRRLRHLGGE